MQYSCTSGFRGGCLTIYLPPEDIHRQRLRHAPRQVVEGELHLVRHDEGSSSYSRGIDGVCVSPAFENEML